MKNMYTNIKIGMINNLFIENLLKSLLIKVSLSFSVAVIVIILLVSINKMVL
jgi:hypothetical protein